MEEIEDKITKCEAFIHRQEKYITAMNSMSKDYIKDQEMATQCLQEILDINRNIQFLKNQLNYLNIEKMILLKEEGEGNEKEDELPYSTYFDQLNVMSNSLTLRKYTEDSLTIDRITFKIQEIEYKRNSDINYMEGFNKLLSIYIGRNGVDGNSRKDLEEASRKVENCQLRINLFDRALSRYIGLSSILAVEYKQDHLIWDNPSPRLQQTGKLFIRLISAKNLFKLKNDELYITISIDNQLKAQSKSVKNDRWMENFEISVEKASELELVVWGKKSGSSPLPIGLFWIPIREISEALRTSSFSSNVLQNKNGGGGFNSLKRTSFHGLNTGEFIESAFTLEPIGQLELKLGFTRQDNINKVSTTEYSKLGRQGAVLKKKDTSITHNGHDFIIKQFYHPMNCALCNEFLMRGSGFVCELCGFFCHKKCGPQVVFKCVSKPAKEVDSEAINHNIDHKFDIVTNLSPNWCCHCGKMLPLGIKSIKKCKSCNIMSHNECFHLVPDLCGLSMKEANSILHEIRLVKNKNKANKLLDPSRVKSSINEITKGLNNLSTSGQPRSIEDYQLVTVLGRGSFGKVILSKENTTNRLFAIKILKKELYTHPTYLDSLRSEKYALTKLNEEPSPFLLGLHACFQSPSRLYFVLDYIQGGDLMFHIQQCDFSLNQVKFYAIEILLGLEHLHKNNIIYRDLKLDNILLGLDGHIKIIDFGLCLEGLGPNELTYSICGTPEFYAPEVLLEQGYNKSVDWWAYGVLLYEMRLGLEPFKGCDEDELYDCILDGEADYPPCLERELVSLIQKLLIKDPQYRIGSGPEDANEIKRHIYFKGVYWDDYLNLKIKPPFIPKTRGSGDISNFDTEFTSEEPVLTPVEIELNEFHQKEFAGFDYTAAN